MTYTLFLDDERHPTDPDAVICRSYAEAVAYVTQHGIPKHVDFDHDLGLGATGYAFAHWLVNRAIDGHGFPETWEVHSQNPIGRANILGLMDGYSSRRNGQ